MAANKKTRGKRTRMLPESPGRIQINSNQINHLHQQNLNICFSEKFDIVVKNHFPKAMDAKDTSIHYLGLMKNDYDIDISKFLWQPQFVQMTSISVQPLFSVYYLVRLTWEV